MSRKPPNVYDGRCLSCGGKGKVLEIYDDHSCLDCGAHAFICACESHRYGELIREIPCDMCAIDAARTVDAEARMNSGDRVDTGTGDARRPLTLAEAEAGGLPEPLTKSEWSAMHRASTGTEAERGAAINHAERVVLTAAIAYVESIYMSGGHDGPYLRRLQTTQGALRAAVKALKAAEAAL